MRPAKKAERAMETIAKLLAQHTNMTSTQIEEIKETAPEDRTAISRQGDAVLMFLESPAKYTAKVCKRCGEVFGTNYRSVGYCSDNCRAKAMYALLGVKWDWVTKSEEERWGGEPPLIIPPEALKMLDRYIQWFDQNRPHQTQSPEPISPLESAGPVFEVRMSPSNRHEPLQISHDPQTVAVEDPFDFQ